MILFFPCVLASAGISAIEPDSNLFITLGEDSSRIQHLYTINFYTGAVLYQPVCDSDISDIHYDVNRKSLYALMYSASGFSLVTLNQTNGSVNVLNKIPGMKTIIGGTSTLGIDSGRFYCMANDTSSTLWLYALEESTGLIKYKIHMDTILSFCQYDTISKMIYSIYYSGKQIFTRLNPTTGIFTTVDTIQGAHSLVGNTSAFAQDSLKYFFDDYYGIQRFFTINVPHRRCFIQPVTW